MWRVLAARWRTWEKARKVGIDDDEEKLKRAPKGFAEDHRRKRMRPLNDFLMGALR